MDPFFGLVVGSLAVWRATHLLHAEDGPWDLLRRMRQRMGAGFLGRLFGCFYCLSLWCAAPVAYGIGSGLWHRVLLWLALSGAAILLERATGESPAQFEEGRIEEEAKDGLLRESIHAGPR